MNSIPNDPLEDIIKGKWQWKSNIDPWSKSEEEKWESYSLEHNYLIEKAYYDHEKEVDLGDYIISIQHKIQIKKGDKVSQRPIRRIDWTQDVEEFHRCERYYEVELPKSINKVFGSLEDFVRQFSNRNPEILEFKKQLDKLEEVNDLNGLNHQILPKVINCFEKEVAKLVLELKEDKNKELIDSFRKYFSSFEEFYKQIIKAYTMSAFLYRNLNKYLRSESWDEIDLLSPYAICICKAFFKIEFFNPQEKMLLGKNSITLYRGATFDESALSHYNPQAVQNFSWNSVTSASTRLKVAERFMYQSTDFKKKKFPVMFIIEVPLLAKEEYLRWIDAKNCSNFQSEDEVILAPGSVFDLQDVFTNKQKITIIKMRLRNEVRSLAYRGVMMQGALQREMMTEKEMKFMCLVGEELSDGLKCISGNGLIEEVEFCLCKFDEKLFQEMLQVLTHMKNLKGLKFISCLYQDKSKISNIIFEYSKNWNLSRIEITEKQSSSRLSRSGENNWEGWITVASFDKGNNFHNNITEKEVNLWCEELKHFPQLTSFNLDLSGDRFQHSGISDKGLRNLCSEGLKYFTQLTSLNLNFSRCRSITDEGMESLCSERLQKLTKLTSLTLEFYNCSNITDEGLNTLVSEGLKNLTQLTYLNLNFENCGSITDEGISSLASQGLKHLTKLKVLNLDFGECGNVTDEGIKDLCSQGLKYLTQLKTLKMNFSKSDQITNKGIKCLSSQGLKHLCQLAFLDLNFSGCFNISDKGVNILYSEGLKHLAQLASLDLDFSDCIYLTEKGVENLRALTEKTLTQLTTLHIKTPDDFDNWSQDGLSDDPIFEELHELSFKRTLEPEKLQMIVIPSPNGVYFVTEKFFEENLKNSLHQLTSLNLNFKKYLEITDEEVKTLCCQGLKNCCQLTSFNLNFSFCKNVTDEGVNALVSEGLKYLTQLTSLTLNLSDCKNITDEGFTKLSSEGLKHLTQLTSLDLSFSHCFAITDEGVNLLVSEGLQNLPELRTLNLDFYNCQGITDEGVKTLVFQGLKHLTQLSSLNIEFSNCKQITDEGLDMLISQGLKHLTQLTFLHIKLHYCAQITKFTINQITRVLHYFGFKEI